MLKLLRKIGKFIAEQKWLSYDLICVCLFALMIFSPSSRQSLKGWEKCFLEWEAKISALTAEIKPRLLGIFKLHSPQETLGASPLPLGAVEIDPSTHDRWRSSFLKSNPQTAGSSEPSASSWPSVPYSTPKIAQTPVEEPIAQSKWNWPSFFEPKKAPEMDPYADRKRYPIPQRITLSHIEGDNFTNCFARSFATNYTKAQLLLAGEYIPGQFLPQIDLRGERFDDITYSASGGVVLRYIPKIDGPVCKILGVNAYYDYRQGNIGYFNQIGGGIEVLSKRWDFRANIYVPVGGKRKMQRCVFDDFVGDFFAIRDCFESISYAFNAEVGWLAINSQYLLLYLAGGPYYLARRHNWDKIRGGEFRIQPQYKDYVALNAIVSHDSLFNTIYQFEIIFHLPIYLLSKKIDKTVTCGLTPRQIYQPVIRYDTMPIGRSCCWQFNWDD
jgi:inverse autotransporter-like protein with beta domain